MDWGAMFKVEEVEQRGSYVMTCTPKYSAVLRIASKLPLKESTANRT